MSVQGILYLKKSCARRSTIYVHKDAIFQEAVYSRYYKSIADIIRV